MIRRPGRRRTAASIFAILILSTSVAAAPPRAKADVAERAADSRDRMVCKRFIETGSLVRGYRTCKTKWEWERERENLRTLSVSESCSKRAEGGDC